MEVKTEVIEREVLSFTEDCFARNVLHQIQAQHEMTEMQQRQFELESR
jgi:hypothetical protein